MAAKVVTKMIRHPSPVSLLRAEFQRAQAKNPRFSLRSFARLLQLSPSFVSHVLGGKKHLSLEVAKKIAARLRIVGTYAEYFFTLVERETAPIASRALLKRKADLLITKIEAHRLRPDGRLKNFSWPHLLLLVFFELEVATSDAVLADLAIEADISPARMQRTLAEISRAGLAVKEGDRWVRTHRQVHFESDQAHATLQNMHTEYLLRAAKLLASRNPPNRYSVTEFHAIPLAKWPEVKTLATEFLDNVTALAACENGDGIVEVGLHLNVFRPEELLGSKP